MHEISLYAFDTPILPYSENILPFDRLHHQFFQKICKFNYRIDDSKMKIKRSLEGIVEMRSGR